MRRWIAISILAGATLGSLAQWPAYAGVFDDDEARQAILDLRNRVDANQRDLSNRLDKLEAGQAGQLQMANQIESLRDDVNRLRGEIEVLNNAIATQDKRSKDYYTDLDTRLRKLEPQQVTVDGQTGQVDPAEQRSYDNATALFKNNDTKGALAAFMQFSRDYPNSIYMPAAQYYIGASYYGQRDFRTAIATEQSVIKSWPTNPHAPDAMFVIASAQADAGDKRAARKSFEILVQQYPDSQAAGLARDRLVSLK